jgi:hypothetical protein
MLKLWIAGQDWKKQSPVPGNFTYLCLEGKALALSTTKPPHKAGVDCIKTFWDSSFFKAL